VTDENLRPSDDPSFLDQFTAAAATEIGEMLLRAGHRADAVLIICEPEHDGLHLAVGASIHAVDAQQRTALARRIVDRAWKAMHDHKPQVTR
jgi:hypothetical protein